MNYLVGYEFVYEYNLQIALLSIGWRLQEVLLTIGLQVASYRWVSARKT